MYILGLPYWIVLILWGVGTFIQDIFERPYTIFIKSTIRTTIFKNPDIFYNGNVFFTQRRSCAAIMLCHNSPKGFLAASSRVLVRSLCVFYMVDAFLITQQRLQLRYCGTTALCHNSPKGFLDELRGSLVGLHDYRNNG